MQRLQRTPLSSMPDVRVTATRPLAGGWSRKASSSTGAIRSRDQPSTGVTVTEAVQDEVRTWQNRILEPLYPIVYLDALQVRMRDNGNVQNCAVHIAIGVQDLKSELDAAKQRHGIGAEQTKERTHGQSG